MRVAGLFLCLLLGAAPAVAEAPAVELASNTAAQWVSFDLTPGNQIRFTMTVNGRPATAVLDTGVTHSLISRRFAEAIGLRPVLAGQADAIGGTVPLGWAAVESLAIGGLTRTGGRLAVADLKAIATGSAEPVEMLIGSDLLGRQALDIDYDARRFRLLPSGRLPFTGTSVPLSIAPDSGVFLSELSIGRHRFKPMIVDTGDGSSVTLSREIWGAARVPTPPLTSAYAFGLGGAIETDLTVLPAVRLAGLTARNVEVRIEGKDGFSQLTGTAGRIGSGLLQRYRVLIDPTAKRMVFAPGKTVDREPLKSTSGLLIALQGRSLRVLHVMRNSPAAAAGWRAGERICAVDGVPIPADYLATPLAAWPAGAPGRTVRLGLCDNGGDRTLTLARFY
ncbi:aspartyl protease family protein [Sphingomonas cannabina]|uniref:aspartyl protease family protein n=1 Tax=Sphingomonas cannabina TaxID=2899123 RepID=UPI001F1F9D6C|nr:aspartyl protease family protein [Sphingomonas cannabina]UIJ46714.1 aspartyl protease family protein [Sphingomonas cannabina]